MKRAVMLTGVSVLLLGAGVACQNPFPDPKYPDGIPVTAEKPAEKKDVAKAAEKPKAPLVYSEATGKDERLYVFATAAGRAHFDKHGEFPTEKFTTKIGAGPKGETVRFENDDAVKEFAKHHP